ncbi:IS6 family transposase (plasmid) [Deinococcus psychrotolerans]|uniref:IS6 family transposase n=1 Tax=Deinococcus psychrotolerans TaxID=2489213 RepID=A0A3G8YJF1_9DEIO|nr:IS6 family transposase [Deinococcus psychrotolerans]AZI45372.1 IS6 family transposase [Deinococcus psychrotolerans]
MTDAKPYSHRFPMTIIQHAVWLYHRFPLSYRDVQELLHQRGIVVVSHETLREWCIKFSPLMTEELRYREPRRGSRWLLDEVCTTVDGVRHWLWRAVDEHGFVLDILLQRHRDTEAAKLFLNRLLAEYFVPDTICTDQLRSYGAAIREIPSLAHVDHQQVIDTMRCNNMIKQSHRPTRRQERSQQRFRRRKRAQEFLSLHARVTNLHHHSRTSVSASTRRQNQKHAFQAWSTVAAGVG